VWVTGSSTADRLAAAYALADRLRSEQRRVEVLDRPDYLGADAGPMGLVAEVLARNGVVAIVPCAAEGLAAVRARHEKSGTRYVEVCVAGQPGPQDAAVEVHGHLVSVGEASRRRGSVA
jgi:adenylylsulfate kinase